MTDQSSGETLSSTGEPRYPTTPDGRYFVVRGRLWRRTDPGLAPEKRAALVSELQSARSAIRHAHGDTEIIRAARQRVHKAKLALGERGPVWWTDGAPDYNRYVAKNTPYADWWRNLSKGGDAG